ncbi:MAG: hypothetical protein Q9N68_08025, partial [Gammaproteobacteria bacterium]|nr:hypothetical protein [Gammaproteobacteria bacterium]
FLNHNALLQINNENELSETVQMLLKQPKKRAHLAHNAQALMQQESTVVARYLKALKATCSR